MELTPGIQAHVERGHYDVTIAGTVVTVEEPPNADDMVKVSRRIETWVHVDDLRPLT